MDDQSETINDDDESLVSTPTDASTSAQANPGNTTFPFRTRPIVDYDLDYDPDYDPTVECRHLTPEEVEAWAEQMAIWTESYEVAPISTQAYDAENEEEDE